MIDANFKVYKKENISVVIEGDFPGKVEIKGRPYLDQVFHDELVKSKKNICVVRNAGHFNTLEEDQLLSIYEDWDKTYDVIFLMNEHLLDPIPYKKVNPNKFVFVLECLEPTTLADVDYYQNVEYIPFVWFRAIKYYNNINQKLWNQKKEYFLTSRMNNPRDWKVDLVAKILSKDKNKILNWSAIKKTDKLKDTPKRFPSEMTVPMINPEIPNLEQFLSYALLCLEGNHAISEKTFQCLCHKIPTIWHTSKAILEIERYGLITRFNGFNYDYLKIEDFNERIEVLSNQIVAMTHQDYKDFYHSNLKETKHNHEIMRDFSYWYNQFTPTITKWLNG